jgi:hypothetical protein
MRQSGLVRSIVLSATVLGFVLTACGCGLESSSRVTSAPAAVTYTEVAEILKLHCTRCHREMTKYKGVMAFVVPGKPEESTLYTWTDTPTSHGQQESKITPAEVAKIKDWILQGAVGP